MRSTRTGVKCLDSPIAAAGNSQSIRHAASASPAIANRTSICQFCHCANPVQGRANAYHTAALPGVSFVVSLSAFFLCLGIALAPQNLPAMAPVPAGAEPLAQTGRYRSPRTYDETLNFYRRLFAPTGGVKWRNIVSMPGIKAKHVESLSKKTRWEGINIYERQGEVRIYIIPRDPVDPAKRP